MNRLWFVISLVLVISANASKLNKTIVFSFSTKLDSFEQMDLKIDDSKIYHNGRLLNSQSVLLGMQGIKYLNNLDKITAKIEKCAGGNYAIKIIENGKAYKETGCIGSKRFGDILTAFKKLETTVKISK